MERRENLKLIFTTVAAEYGFENITAEFSPEHDLKIAWKRAGTWIDFWISDYLEEAPDVVLESLADSICSGILQHREEGYVSDIVDYLTDPEFLRINQGKYLSRVNGASRTGEGRHKDLEDSYSRLVKDGLIEFDPDIELRWAPLDGANIVGQSSVLMKVACLNRRLDLPNIPDDLLDFALYSQLCFITAGFLKDAKIRNATYKKNMDIFPDHQVFESQLNKMGMKLTEEMSPAD